VRQRDLVQLPFLGRPCTRIHMSHYNVKNRICDNSVSQCSWWTFRFMAWVKFLSLSLSLEILSGTILCAMTGDPPILNQICLAIDSDKMRRFDGSSWCWTFGFMACVVVPFPVHPLQHHTRATTTGFNNPPHNVLPTATGWYFLKVRQKMAHQGD
jgi:hypothetical protein